MPLYNKGGEQIFVSLNIDLVDINGKPYILSTIQNITQRKQVEQALSEQNERLEHFTEELQRSNQALEDFAFIASHDLQEPLRKIHSFGNILRSRSPQHLEGEEQDYLDRMIQTTARMQSMLDGLMAYSRVMTQGSPFARVNLTQAAFEALTDLEIRVKQTGGQVEIGVLPTVDADAVQMRQLFQNLIGNALKFHRPGIAPRVTISGEIRSNGEAIVSVEDNGIGFDEQFSNQLFKPFRRLHGMSEYEGSGIGLAICKKIVERHAGAISVRSSPGEGTIFTFCMPGSIS
jgi:light-regulated signal transduction histidine kinase (bacteriophytochrome)